MEPRKLRGVIIEIKHDIAEINLGELHGLAGGEVLNVQALDEAGAASGKTIGTITITSVQQRSAKGKLTRLVGSIAPRAGHRVAADLNLPLREVVLPFAASSAAAADQSSIYVGAANQKFYCVDILRGVQRWSILTPHAVAAQPELVGPNLYIAGQDGLVISCTKQDKRKNWTYNTEGPIFADLLLTPDRVYAASSDRSLYCLDRKSGKRRWRERFDSPLMDPPKYSDNRIYQIVPDGGLFVLDAETGAQVWKRPQGGHFLVQINQDVYLADEHSPVILRVDAHKGKVKNEVDVGLTAAISASDLDDEIFLSDRSGSVMSIRSRFAERLKPDDLTQVLRDDRKMRIAAELDQARVAKVEKKKEEPRRLTSRDLLFEQDWLTSHSNAKPVGGHALEGDEPKPQGKAEKKTKSAASDEEANDEKQTDSGDADSGDKDKSAKESDDEDAKDEGDKDVDEDSSDDSKDDKEADDEGGDEDDKDSGDDSAKKESGGKKDKKKTGG